MLKTKFFLFVALGGVLGSIFREFLTPLMPAPYPWVTILVINGVGSFIIGVVYGIEHRLHPHLKSFSAVGFCGGFTTLSHFTFHTIQMLENGQVAQAISNIVLSLVLTILAVWLGLWVTDFFKPQAGVEA